MMFGPDALFTQRREDGRVDEDELNAWKLRFRAFFVFQGLL
jgi:hypothetical protein